MARMVGKTVTGTDPVTGRFVSMTPRQFAEELLKKSYKPPTRMSRTVNESCKNVVAMAKQNVRQTAPIHNGNAYKYIDHEIHDTKTGTIGVVGYNRTFRPARLGNLLEFGGPGINGDPSPAHWDIKRAMEAEEDNFYKKIGDDAESYIESRWDNKGLG